jgi:hypothetical protein
MQARIAKMIRIRYGTQTQILHASAPDPADQIFPLPSL